MSYGNDDRRVAASYRRDEHRLRASNMVADPLADELDDRVEVELARERLADLVDERELGVALAGLLDRASAGRAPKRCAGRRRPGGRVVLVVVRARRRTSGRRRRPTSRLATSGAPSQSLAARRRPPDLAGADEVLPARAGRQQRLAASAGRRPSVPRAPRRRRTAPTRAVGESMSTLVDVVREVDRLALRRRTARCRSSGVHQLADDRRGPRIERGEVLGRAGGFGDPVAARPGPPRSGRARPRARAPDACLGRRVVRHRGQPGAGSSGDVGWSSLARGTARGPRGGRSSRTSPARPAPR